MTDPNDLYGAHVEEAASRFESVDARDVHAWLADLLPKAPALALDVGAGTGRDAAWLSELGLEVVAVEPATRMRELAQALHPSPSIRWMDDSLPGLARVFRLGLSFDLVLLSGVWMFVPPTERPRAFRKLMTLLKPGGRIAMILRQGPLALDRGMHAASAAELEHLARTHGAFVERLVHDEDRLGRDGVSWTDIAIRLPDDATGALPLLRHIILNDSKSSTYKLALLRVLCRIADGAAGYARDTEDGESVSVPLGLVGLYWIRLFKPLLAAGLPQSRKNLAHAGLGFVREGFRALADVSHLDLRVGMGFDPARSEALHFALRDACATITNMPAHYITYSNGAPVLPVTRGGRVAQPRTVRLEAPYLWSFGELSVPSNLWRALQRFDVWIEPALVTEWSRLMSDYAERQGRRIEEGSMAAAMAWSDPLRDVRLAKTEALRLMDSGTLHCVWSGRRLSPDSLDIDHCFPWAAWPCDDLWNLLPTHRIVNQREKRERLPGMALLRSSEDRIEDWWTRGYLEAGNPRLGERFMSEARATLPMLGHDESRLDDVFAALNMQQIRLRHDQQAPVWEPEFAAESL